MGPKNILVIGEGTLKLAYFSLQIYRYWTALIFVIITVHSLYVTLWTCGVFSDNGHRGVWHTMILGLLTFSSQKRLWHSLSA